MTKLNLENTGYILHSAKGTGWKNHKYIDKWFKNGKWFYKYPNKDKGSKDSNSNTHTLEDYKTTNEYYKIHDGKMEHYTEKTRNGSGWLTKKTQVQFGNDVTVYKDKGKISQSFDKAVEKGASFINSLKTKKKK